MQMLAKAAMGLATNKKVQRMAMNAGYNLGLGAAKRIQQRRRKQGKPQLFRNITAQPKTLLTRQTESGMPLRMQTALAATPASSTSRQVGSGLITNVGWTGTTVVNSMVINPSSNEFVARLAKEAAMYQKFVVNYMKFRYVNTVAGTQDGTLYMVVLPDVNIPKPANPDEISQMGGFISTAVTSSAVISVPTTAVNKAYKYQFTGDEDDTLHTAGRLCWCVTGVTSTSSINMGSIHCDYNITFSDPKISYTDQTSGGHEYLMSGAAAIPLDDPDSQLDGVLSFRDTYVADVYKRRGKQASVLFFYGYGKNTSPVLAVTGGEDPGDLASLTPQHYGTTGDEYFAWYVVPAGEYYLKANVTGGYWTHNRVWLLPYRA